MARPCSIRPPDFPLLIGNDRRFSQRVYLRELGRCETGYLVTLVALDVVFNTEFFKQPQDSLRARVFKVVKSNHVSSIASNEFEHLLLSGLVGETAEAGAQVVDGMFWVGGFR